MKGIALSAIAAAAAFAQAGTQKGGSAQVRSNPESAQNLDVSGRINADLPPTHNLQSFGVPLGDTGSGQFHPVPLYSTVPGPAAFIAFAVGGVSLLRRRLRYR